MKTILLTGSLRSPPKEECISLALALSPPSHILATPPGILYNRAAGWVELGIQR